MDNPRAMGIESAASAEEAKPAAVGGVKTRLFNGCEIPVEDFHLTKEDIEHAKEVLARHLEYRKANPLPPLS